MNVHFSQFSKANLLFDLSKQSKDKIDEKVEGCTNTLLLLETESQIFGAFYSIPMPKVTSHELYYNDNDSYIFEVLIKFTKLFPMQKNTSKHFLCGFIILEILLILMGFIVIIIKSGMEEIQVHNIKEKIILDFVKVKIPC